MDINIMMIGGRRCGKTSVLASMQDSFDKCFGKSNLTIDVDSASMITLSEKINANNKLYAMDKSKRITPDETPTSERMEYTVSLSLKSKPNGKINYNFIDFPGEWLTSPAHIKEVEADVKQSSVIIVAIDTPHLMEKASDNTANTVGLYNQNRNCCSQVCNFLKKIDLKDKMILFVPLKCERYRNTNQMDLVNGRIKTAYQSFFNHIDNDNNRNSCITVIAPIFTLGTVEFTRFDSENGEIIIDENYDTPKYPLYAFSENAGNSPEPKYCEQPLLYVLMYLLNNAEKEYNKKHKKSIIAIFLRNLINTFLKMPSANDFMRERKNIDAELKKSGDGYEIITDPLNLRGLTD